jgi:pSer/pThr/pTyr-binding forkhead associated (FHA) protein
MTLIHGYDELIQCAIDERDGDLRPFIEFVGDRETHWLEFKAAMPSAGGDGWTAADHAWHISRALIALANTDGGAVILGLDDDCRPVGLEPSDAKGHLSAGGFDQFCRSVLLQRLLQPGEWKTPKAHYRLGRVLTEVRCREASFDGVRVAVLLVPPVGAGEESVLVEQIRPVRTELFLVRSKGDVGNIRNLVTTRERAKFKNLRGKTPLVPSQLWERYQRWAMAKADVSARELTVTAAELALDCPAILLRRPDGTWSRRELPRELTTVGRDESCPVRVTDDPRLSRRHFSLRWEEGFELRDEGSRGGTQVDGVRLAPGEPHRVQGRRIKIEAGRTVAYLIHADRRPPAATWSKLSDAQSTVGRMSTVVAVEAVESPDQPTIGAMAPGLRQINGHLRGEFTPIPPYRPIFIGRMLECNLRIDDADVADCHARVSIEEDDAGNRPVMIRALTEDRPTLVNDKRISVCHLVPGDRIRLGAVEFEYGFTEQGARPAEGQRAEKSL